MSGKPVKLQATKNRPPADGFVTQALRTTYFDTGPWFLRSHPKDQYPRPIVRFEPATQGSSVICPADLVQPNHKV
jgi:hypothetical protein